MTCPKCGKEQEEGLRLCASCGADMNEAPEKKEEPNETAVTAPAEKEKAPLETPVNAPVDAETETSPAAAAAPKSPKKKIPIAGIIIAVLVVIIGVLAAMLGSKIGTNVSEEENITLEGSSSDANVSSSSDADASSSDESSLTVYDIQMVDYTEADLTGTVIANADLGIEVDNIMFNYYYWAEYYYMMSSYSSYISYYLDTTAPLSEQMYDDVHTWQDYFTEAAIATYIQTQSICAEARAAGFEMPEENAASMEETIENLQLYATEYDYADVDAYISASYGEGATLETFKTYLEDSFLSSAYTDELYNSTTATEEEIEAFFDEHVDEYTQAGVAKDDTRIATVRHILKAFETDDEGNVSDEEREATKQVAEAIYDSYLNNEQTGEQMFSAYAQSNSDDEGTAEDGGLLEGILPGDTVEAFNDWVFDEERQPGDTGLVETEYGWHIIYFVEYGDYYWHLAAMSDCVTEKFYTAIEDAMAKYSFDVDKAEAVIITPKDVQETYDAAAEAAEQAAAEAETEEAEAETSEVSEE